MTKGHCFVGSYVTALMGHVTILAGHVTILANHVIQNQRKERCPNVTKLNLSTQPTVQLDWLQLQKI